jgi:hypothetical protein
VPRPDETEFLKLKWLLSLFQKSEEYCRPYWDRAKRHYKLYRFSTAVSDEDWPYVNRVRSRDILAFVEDTTAMLVQTLFATTPFISIIPRETGNSYVKEMGIDLIKVGKQIERVLDYQLSHEDTDFFEEIIDLFKAGAIQGNSYIGVYPKFEGGEYVLPLLKSSGFWDVLPVPGSNRVSKARGIFVREFCRLEDLKELEKMGVYRNVSEVTEIGTDTDQWHKELLEEVGLTGYYDTNDIEVIHYFSGGHVITFANRKVFLRDSTIPAEDGTMVQPYPYAIPIVQYKNVPVPNEFFAMGIPEILEVLQEDKNLIRSARRDNIDLCINKILMTKEGADVNYDLLKFFPGAIWPDSLGKIEAFEIHDVTQSSYAEEKQIQSDMENALSLFGYARGQTPAHTEQPTTVMKLQQASMNRQDINIKLVEYTVLQEIARKIVALNRQYMSQQTYEAILGEPDAGFYKLPIEYVNRCYVMKPVGSSITNIKEVRQKQIQFALETLMNPVVPQLMQTNVQPFTVDYYEVLKEALDVADVKTIDRILKVAPPPDPLQQMLGGLGGGGMMGGQPGKPGQMGAPAGGGMGGIAQLLSDPNILKSLSGILPGMGGMGGAQ